MNSVESFQDAYSPPYNQTVRKNNAEVGYRPASKKKAFWKTCLLGFFVTRELSKSGNRESYVKYAVIELLIYTLYLANLSLLIYVELTSTVFYYNRILKDFYVSKTFEQSSTIRDVWNVLNPDERKQTLIDQDLLLTGIYWEDRYKFGAFGIPIQRSDEDIKFGVLYETQLLGVPQLRQHRVKPMKKCILEAQRNDFPTLADRKCYPEYSFDNEDRGNKDKQWDGYSSIPPEIQSAWVYKPGDLRTHWGLLKIYGSGGAVINLGRTKKESRAVFKQLLENLWIQRSTRVIFLDFTVYNANLNLFCVVRLIWEFGPTGGVVTSNGLKIVKLIRYTTWQEKYVLFTCEIIFIVFTLYYTLQEIFVLCKLGCKKFIRDFWSYIDITILVISFCAIGFKLYSDQVVSEMLLELSLNQNKFYNFQPLAYWSTQINRIIAIGMFIAWIKVCKYIGFNQTMNQFSNTMGRCAKEMLAFAIFLFFIFFGFAQAGHLLFGQDNSKFGTLRRSCFALFSIVVGDFTFENIEDTDRILGPIFFFAFVFFVFLVLVNMFIAIINDAYQEVKAEIQSATDQLEVVDYFKTRIKTLGKQKVQRSLNSEEEGKISLKEVINLLKRCNFTLLEIEMFLARFDLDQRRELDYEEASYILQDLENTSFGREDKNVMIKEIREMFPYQKEVVSQEEYLKIEHHIQKMDDIFSSSLNKLNEALDKLRNN